MKVDDDNQENEFYFSIEEIKKKYQDFLNLTTETETPPDEGEIFEILDDENKEGSEENLLDKRSNEAEEDWENLDVVQEIRDLDEHTQENLYQDMNYWKPVIDYNIDELINEIKK